jgi:hypothetical protein
MTPTELADQKSFIRNALDNSQNDVEQARRLLRSAWDTLEDAKRVINARAILGVASPSQDAVVGR